MYFNKTINNFLIFIGCVGIMFLFRVIPHPPNFTPVIALSLYLPIFFGLWSIPFFILGFAVTDYFIEFHSLLIWTWSSLALVGLLSQLAKGKVTRLLLAFTGALIFFLISNFGVWLTSSFYESNIQGLINCYVMAIPFFTNTLISTIIFGALIEILISSKNFVFTTFLKKTN